MNATVREYSASDAGLANAMHTLEADALALGLGHRIALTLVLMLEELYTNTLKYGRRDDAAAAAGTSMSATVRVTLHAPPGADVELRYEDTGEPHDPFTAMPEHELDAEHDGPVEDRPVGRLGILLLRRLSRRVSYEYRHGRNTVQLWVGTDVSPADFQSP